MKLNNKKSYFINVMCYDDCERSVLFSMPDGEMLKHLEDNNPKCYFDMPIDEATSFHYDCIKQDVVNSYNENGYSHLDLIKATMIGDTMGYEGMWDDFNYTIIEITEVYECYWDKEDKCWWYKDENIFEQYLKGND
jgi:hypothetical protein